MFGDTFKFKMEMSSGKRFYAWSVKCWLIVKIMEITTNLGGLLKQWERIYEIEIV